MALEKDSRGYDVVEWQVVANGWTEQIHRYPVDGGWLYRYTTLNGERTTVTLCFGPRELPRGVAP